MQYISPENAAERRRDMRRRADAARLAREARRAGAGGSWRRLGRRVARALADGARAQRRVAVLNASPDRHLPHPHQPPATYREFLARTAGPLLCEPPAIARFRGHRVG